MDEKIPISKLFSRYEPDEAGQVFFTSACVLHADIDAQARTMTVYLQSECYLPQRQLSRMGEEIAKLYGVRQLHLEPKYSPACLDQFDYNELKDLIIKIIVYVVAGVVIGTVASVIGLIPLIGGIIGWIVGTVANVYTTAGWIIAILDYLKVLK